MSGLSVDEARDLLPLYAGGDLDEQDLRSVDLALAAFPELQAELEAWSGLEDRLSGAFDLDVAELIPLYAGGDVTPGQRVAVEAELAARPELHGELAQFKALEGLLERSLQPLPLDVREAAELLPLLAGGDLDPVATAQVEQAVGLHPELEGELAVHRAVDARLHEAYPEAEVEAPAREGRIVPLVRLQCPFCHDALRNAPVALCGSCSTPHHTGCFEQNQGCSILGCEGTEAVARRQATLRVCGECGRHTQADAPFCAWCGTANTSRRVPLHARRDSPATLVLKPATVPAASDPAPPPGVEQVPAASGRPPRDVSGWLRAAAAIALTLSSLGAGLAFGRSEQRRVRDWATATGFERIEAAEARALASLEAIREAQRKFLRYDWDGDKIADYAESLAELRGAARQQREDAEDLLDSSWEAWFSLTWSQQPPTGAAGAGYELTLRQRYPELGDAGWRATHEGPIAPLAPEREVLQ